MCSGGVLRSLALGVGRGMTATSPYLPAGSGARDASGCAGSTGRSAGQPSSRTVCLSDADLFGPICNDRVSRVAAPRYAPTTWPWRTMRIRGWGETFSPRCVEEENRTRTFTFEPLAADVGAWTCTRTPASAVNRGGRSPHVGSGVLAADCVPQPATPTATAARLRLAIARRMVATHPAEEYAPRRMLRF